MTGGAGLSGRFWTEVVRPLLQQRWPGLAVGAARMGAGSDVLGYDDDMSRDHDWGLRLTLAVDGPSGQGGAAAAAVEEHLAAALPQSFQGHPVRFATSWDVEKRHRVEVAPTSVLLHRSLGADPRDGLRLEDWLSLTGQAVLEVTAGTVFADPTGGLTAARAALAWYPDDVWSYAVSSAWTRMDQDLPLVGRTGHRGDEAGSRALAARVTATALHLAFVLERRWAPYAKWRGTAARALPDGGALLAALHTAHEAATWQERQAAVAALLAGLLERQRRQGLPTGPGPATVPFHDRPFLSVAPATTALLRQGTGDPAVRALPRGVGVVEQWVDSVDVLTSPQRRRAAVRGLLAAGA